MDAPDRPLKVGLVSVSDRASGGVYKDEGIPALKDWLGRALASEWTCVERLIPDERAADRGDARGSSSTPRAATSC